MHSFTPMSEKIETGALLLAGSSGTLGSVLVREMEHSWQGSLISIGRRNSLPVAPSWNFLKADFRDQTAMERICAEIESMKVPIEAIVFASGIDCRSGIYDLDVEDFGEAMAVNCLGPLQLVRAAIQRASGRQLRIWAASSDVVNSVVPGTVVYGASKAALEEGLRHACADELNLSVVAARLSELGNGMLQVRNVRGVDRRPLRAEVINKTIRGLRQFLTYEAFSPGFEVRHVS